MGEYFLFNLTPCVFGCNIWWWCCNLRRKVSTKNWMCASKLWATLQSAYVFEVSIRRRKTKVATKSPIVPISMILRFLFCFLIFVQICDVFIKFLHLMLKASSLGGVWIQIFWRQGARHSKNFAGQNGQKLLALLALNVKNLKVVHLPTAF